MLGASDLYSAEMAIIRYLQYTEFGTEVNDLTSHGKVNRSSRRADLKPFVQQGLLQVGGRLTLSPVSEGVKHPIILPGDHHITSLVIR